MFFPGKVPPGDRGGPSTSSRLLPRPRECQLRGHTLGPPPMPASGVHHACTHTVWQRAVLGRTEPAHPPSQGEPHAWDEPRISPGSGGQQGGTGLAAPSPAVPQHPQPHGPAGFGGRYGPGAQAAEGLLMGLSPRLGVKLRSRLRVCSWNPHRYLHHRIVQRRTFQGWLPKVTCGARHGAGFEPRSGRPQCLAFQPPTQHGQGDQHPQAR